ncbi:hypothetical protein VTK26DRAFT_9355 [Humicola hyalothermophila]
MARSPPLPPWPARSSACDTLDRMSTAAAQLRCLAYRAATSRVSCAASYCSSNWPSAMRFCSRAMILSIFPLLIVAVAVGGGSSSGNGAGWCCVWVRFADGSDGSGCFSSIRQAFSSGQFLLPFGSPEGLSVGQIENRMTARRQSEIVAKCQVTLSPQAGTAR